MQSLFGTPNGPIKVGASASLRYPPTDLWETGYAGQGLWAGDWWDNLTPWERWVADEYTYYLYACVVKRELDWDDLEQVGHLIDEVQERVARCVPGFWDIGG